MSKATPMPKANVSTAATTAAKSVQTKPLAKKAAPAKSAATAKSAVAAKSSVETATPPPAVKPTKALEAPKPAKVPKLRQKPVRDSFTMPASDFGLIAALKARLLAAKHETKKSELLRAGLHALAALDTPFLVAAIGKLDQVKVGRPKKSH